MDDTSPVWGTLAGAYETKPDVACEAELKKRTLTNLYNQRPTWLPNAHVRLNVANYAAYRWPADLPD
jgi:hypothetical protein